MLQVPEMSKSFLGDANGAGEYVMLAIVRLWHVGVSL
jgi:hypothetical protein